MTLTDTEAIKRAVMASLGIAAVFRMCAGLELAAGLLKEVPTCGLDLRRALYEVTPRGRQLSPSAQAFVGLFSEQPRV